MLPFSFLKSFFIFSNFENQRQFSITYHYLPNGSVGHTVQMHSFSSGPIILVTVRLAATVRNN